jgi:drug/metabolite transporter (DMT)-like permease
MRESHQTLGLVLGLLAVTIFGGSLPATRMAVAGLDPWFVTVGRATLGGLIAVGLLTMSRTRFPRAHLGRLSSIALLLVIGFPAAMAIASVTVPAAHGGVILGLLPLATAIAAVPLAGERPSLYFWLLSLAGAGLVVSFALRAGDIAIVTGDIFLALAVIMTGIGYTLAATLSRTLPGWQVIAWALVVALPFAIVATILLWPADAASVPLSSWAGLVYGGIMSQFVGYSLWNAALAAGGVARIGQLQLLQPFVTFIIAALILSEAITPTMVAYAVAVAVVVALGRRAAIGQRPVVAG